MTRHYVLNVCDRSGDVRVSLNCADDQTICAMCEAFRLEIVNEECVQLVGWQDDGKDYLKNGYAIVLDQEFHHIDKLDATIQDRIIEKRLDYINRAIPEQYLTPLPRGEWGQVDLTVVR